MTERSPDPPAAPRSVSVRVTRTGGFAGLRREWRTEAEGPDARFWIALIERCAWDDSGGGARDAAGADRFVWGIRARCDGDERSAELADADVRGPWRQLVDEVRDRGTTAAP